MRIRSKMVSLIAVPLIALAVVGAVGFARQSAEIEKAEDASVEIQRAVVLQQAILAVGDERLLVAGDGSGTRLEDARAASDDAIAAIGAPPANFSDEQTAQFMETIDAARTLSGEAALDEFGQAIDAMSAAVAQSADRYPDAVTHSVSVVNQESVEALDDRESAWFDYFDLPAGAVDNDQATGLISTFVAADASREFTADLADSGNIERFESIAQMSDVQRLDRLEATALDDLLEGQVTVERGEAVELLTANRSAWTSAIALQQETLETTISDNLAGANDIRSLFTLLAILGMVVLAGLIFVMYRSITGPLESLLARASSVAEEELPTLMTTLRDAESVESIPKAELIPGQGNDEIGELVAAFNDVQTTAYDLATEQALSRRNVAEMFVNLGRRNQQLLQRILGLLTDLERQEENPEKLAELFQLDNIVTRMRRNAESLLALAGAQGVRRWTKPISMENTVRAAFGEVDGYERIDVVELSEALVVGGAVADITHLLAELLENAINFSEPQTRVRVNGRQTLEGYAITINDQGIGMTATELAENNLRITDPPPLDQVPTRFLGLYVVGRLADRHGIIVRLLEGEQFGTTAKVLVPASLLAGGQEPEQQGALLVDEDGVDRLDSVELEVISDDSDVEVVSTSDLDEADHPPAEWSDSELSSESLDKTQGDLDETLADRDKANGDTASEGAADDEPKVPELEPDQMVERRQPIEPITDDELADEPIPAPVSQPEPSAPVAIGALPVRQRGQALEAAGPDPVSKPEKSGDTTSADSATDFSSMLSSFSSGISQAVEATDPNEGEGR